MTAGHTLFVALCRYGADALALREAAMAEHLAYLRTNRERLRFAGPLLADDGRTPTGSLAIVEVADRAGAETFVSEEAFSRAGMFDRVEIHRFASEIGDRQVHITLRSGWQLYLCRYLAPPGGASPDGASGPARAPEGARLLESGALLDDDGDAPIGRLAIVEAADRARAHEVVAHDLRRPVGAGDDVLVSRWRFGQALGGA